MKNFSRTLLLALGLSGSAAFSQTPQSSSAPKDTTILKEENVEGIFEFAGYLGKKLLKEMGNRMNLEESVPAQPAEKRKVKISLGPFKMERIESK